MGRGKQDRRTLSTGYQDTGALVQLLAGWKSERVLGLVGLFGVGLFESNRPTAVRHRKDSSRTWRTTPAMKYFGFWQTLRTARRVLALFCTAVPRSLKLLHGVQTAGI